MQMKGITVFSEKLVKIIILLRKQSNVIGDVRPDHTALSHCYLKVLYAFNI